MKELSDSKLSRPLVLGNDTGVINNLLGFLNNPEITGAQAPAPQKVLAPKQPVPTAPVEIEPPSGPPVSPTVTAAPKFIFLTGRPGSGRRFLAKSIGATIISLDAGVRSLIATLDPNAGTNYESLIPEIRAWGCGSGKPSIGQLLFVSTIHELVKSGVLPEQYENFGSENFWADTALALAADYSGPVVITDVTREADFRRLVSSGYSHYHVMCAPGTPGKRGVSGADSFASALDNDVIRQISANRSGTRLRCVWNDTVSAPAPRFYSVADFVGLFKQ